MLALGELVAHGDGLESLPGGGSPLEATPWAVMINSLECSRINESQTEMGSCSRVATQRQ